MTHTQRMNLVDKVRRLKRKKTLTHNEKVDLTASETALVQDTRSRVLNDSYRLSVLPADTVAIPYSTYANRQVLARHLGVRPEAIEACAAGTMVGTRAVED